MLNIALLIFMIVTWAYSWVLMKIGLRYMEPFSFAAWRCGVGGLTLLPIVLLRGLSLPTGGKWLDYAVIGFFQTTGMFGLMLYGMQFVTAGKTAVLLYTMAIWTTLIVHFYLKEKINTRQWIGVVLGGIGILCILGWDTLVNQSWQILFGELLVIIAAIMWAVANVWIKKRMSKDDPYLSTCFQLLMGASGLAVLSLAAGGPFNIDWTPTNLGIVLFTGIVASAANFTIWFHLIKHMDINTATFSSLLVPVCGLVFDRIIIGTRLDAGIIVGGVLILAGLYKVSKK